MSKTTYSDSGVNIELGDEASKILYEASKKTWENRKERLGEVIVPFDDFSGVRAIDVSALPKGTLMGMGFDGVGTKLEIAERMDRHDTVAHDLLAMVCDDAVVRGAEPVLVGSILDVNTLGEDSNSYLDKIKQIASGYVEAAKVANVAVFNGELAEVGKRVSGFGDFNYNWGASVLWFAEKEKMFTGFEVKAGDKLIGLEEKGFRSNGLSLARKIFKTYYGENWHNEVFNGEKIGNLVLTPTQIYSSLIMEMIGNFQEEKKVEIHAVSHITGGGLPGKLGRILRPSGLGANIDNLMMPPEVMFYAQQIGNVSDTEVYKTWCMGQGMVVVSPDPEGVISIAKNHQINAQVIGEVTKESGIRIKSKGYLKGGEYLEF